MLRSTFLSRVLMLETKSIQHTQRKGTNINILPFIRFENRRISYSLSELYLDKANQLIIDFTIVLCISNVS